MPIDPVTLLVLGGGALLMASRKKPKKTVTNGGTTDGGGTVAPPECPVGFYWDDAQRACVPSGDGPPQIHVTGLCEWWQMLPHPQVWFDQYAAVVLAETAAAIQATPTGGGNTVLVGAQEMLTPEVLTHIILSNSPIAFSTPEFPHLGLLCKLPLSEELGPDADPGAEVPAAMVDLDAYVYSYVMQALAAYNESGQFQFPEITA